MISLLFLVCHVQQFMVRYNVQESTGIKSPSVSIFKWLIFLTARLCKADRFKNSLSINRTSDSPTTQHWRSSLTLAHVFSWNVKHYNTFRLHNSNAAQTSHFIIARAVWVWCQRTAICCNLLWGPADTQLWRADSPSPSVWPHTVGQFDRFVLI